MGLVFTLAALLLTIGAVMAGRYQHRIAGSAKDRDLAFQAAEAALRDAELAIMCKTYAASSNILNACVGGASNKCLPGCGGGPPASRFAVGFQPSTSTDPCPGGICTPSATATTPAWDLADWTSTSANTTAIGERTDHPNLTTGVVPGILDIRRQPRYLIEAVPALCNPTVDFCTYRITAKGFGNVSSLSATPSVPTSTVTLQELYRPW